MKVRYLNESIETANKFVLKKVPAEDLLTLLKKYNFTLLNDINLQLEKGNLLDFYTTDHHLVYYENVLIGILSFKNFFDTWNDIYPEMTHEINPLTKKEEETGHYTLWVSLLEILQSAKLQFPGISTFEFVRSILDYLILYCKKYGYKVINCAAKDLRVKRLYQRAGFFSFGNDSLDMIYLVDN